MKQSFSKSFISAIKGVWHVLRERNFAVQFVCGITAISLSFIFRIALIEKIIIIFISAFVLVLEMINSSLERLSDVIIKEHHPGIAKVKEIAAGAVLFASIMALIIGILIFRKYIN